MHAPSILPDASPTMPVGAHLFDEALHVTEISDFGIRFEDLLSGRAAVPPQGARFDIAYEGAIEGERLNGYIKGVDYAVVRPDGRFQLNIYATLTTDDGEKIAVTSGGLMMAPDPATGRAQLRLNMTFSTASPAYAWVNAIQAWGTGSVDLQTREISMSLYRA